MSGCWPDFGRTAEDYARHRAGFPTELLDRLAERGLVRGGARVADVGTGTGASGPRGARHGQLRPRPGRGDRVDLDVHYSHEDWVGRVRASAPVAGTLASDDTRRCSDELAALLRERFPEEPLAVPHRV